MDKNAVSIITDNAACWATLLRWFPDQPQLTQWAGPGIQLPLTPTQLQQLLTQHGAVPCAMRSEDGSLIGFGQFKLQRSCVHLSRLAISPAQRGRGLGRQLVTGIIKLARQQGLTEPVSLFVYRDNQAAIRCYTSLGFAPAALPKGVQAPPDDCLFMVNHPPAN